MQTVKKDESALMFLKGFDDVRPARIVEIARAHPFLKNFINEPEIFRPLLGVSQKGKWQEKPVIESGEPLIALTAYRDGKQTKIHSRIFPKAAYFEQGIPGALPIIYVRRGVALTLLKFIELLPPDHGIRVYDGFRPFAVQDALFKSFYDNLASRPGNENLSGEELTNETKKYVSLPSQIPTAPSTHNTGGAIDFSICDMDGNELNYGCVFDDFRPIAALSYFEEKLLNGDRLDDGEIESLLVRRIQANLARCVGLSRYPYECWHFDKGNQWDSEMLFSQYGGCESGHISPDPENTIGTLIAGDDALSYKHSKYLNLTGPAPANPPRFFRNRAGK